MDPVGVHNVLNSTVRTAERYREAHGWRLPVTTAHDVSFAIKAARAPAQFDLRATLAKLQEIGREGTWVDEAGMRAVAERTGATMKHLESTRKGLNAWLSNLDKYIASLGELDEAGRLHMGGLAWTGGLTTAMVLAGDDFSLAPWILTYALLSGARILCKPSSVEPLSGFLFARAALAKGLKIPALIYLDTSTDEGVESIIEIVKRAEQSVVFGEDQTIIGVYQRAQVMPPHKAVPYWSGRSGAIVLAGADLAAAARDVITAATMDRGNKCITTKKVWAPAAERERFDQLLMAAADALVRGDPLDPQVDLGPQEEWARKLADRAAGTSQVFYDKDVILAHVGDDRSQLICGEVPYPIVGVRYYEPHEDPVELHNAAVKDTPFGRSLHTSVFTRDDAAFRLCSARLRTCKALHNRPTSVMDPLRTHQAMHAFVELMRPQELVSSFSDLVTHLMTSLS
jgi:hypothetical protein